MEISPNNSTGALQIAVSLIVKKGTGNELKLDCEQIGRSCAIGMSTVHKYLKRAEAAGLTWPLPEDWMRRGWNPRFPRPAPPAGQLQPAARAGADFATIHEQLSPHGI